MAKRSKSPKNKLTKSKTSNKSKTSKKGKATKPAKAKGRTATKATTKSKAPKPSTSKKAAAKKAAKIKAIEAARIAEATAATTVNFAPAPFETVADHDPSKAPGHQHRHPPESLHGVKHSREYIAKARTPFNRRMNIGR